MKTNELKEKLQSKQLDQDLISLYMDASIVDRQRERYINALERFEALYGPKEVAVYSAAGRSEIAGNHTDHQQGRVLAASINLDAIAIVSKQEDIIKVVSDDFDIEPISMDDLAMRPEEKGSSEALIRGVCARLKEEGYAVGGFQAYITSDVLVGAGLSSSAAFETIVGTILSGVYNDMGIDMVTIAQAGQYAENVYFGKPCGLMDQCACAVGGLITIDFKDPEAPRVEEVDVDFSKYKTSLCIVDTKGSHADLTDEYAAIPQEMKQVAQFFGKEVLRQVEPKEFYEAIPALRLICSDRAILRALHFFQENQRVKEVVQALEQGDFERFKEGIQASGDSSYKYLQNVYAASDPYNQAVSIGLACSETILGTHGISRVHGGGFAGTIQAFVEDDYVETYRKEIEKIFGAGSCHVLHVRDKGGCKIWE